MTRGRNIKIFETPNLIGMDLEEAKFTILGSGLSVGEIYYEKKGIIYSNYENENGDTSVKEIDAGLGIIFKQKPEFPKKIRIGKKINLWVVSDTTSLNKQQN